MADLREYLRHRTACSVFDKLKQICDCGLEQALAATPAVGILSREESDRLLSECGYEPATPAVGMDALIEGIAKTIWLAEFIRAFDRTPYDPWENQAEFSKDGHRNSARKIIEAGFVAAKPASPLRGRDALASISRAVYRIREWAKNEGPYSEFIKEAAIIERRIEQIALASPPEQPAACEAVANWMTLHGYATGHGDTLDDLLTELVAHVSQLAVTPVKTKETSE